MSRGIYIALSGALAQSTTLEATATNLANASTNGYQRSMPVFREVLASQRAAGPFTAPRGVAIDRRQGALRTTGRPLDVAFPEGSYLAVQTPGGQRYTRDGALTLGTDGTLKTGRGHVVVGENGRPIVAKVTSGGADVRIERDGQVFQGTSAIGRLRVVSFSGADNLVHEGGNLLAPAAAGGAPPPVATAPIEVGVLEDSNATAIESMTALVSASRTFDAFERAMQAFHDADRKVISSVPGT